MVSHSIFALVYWWMIKYEYISTSIRYLQCIFDCVLKLYPQVKINMKTTEHPSISTSKSSAVDKNVLLAVVFYGCHH